jgi:Domain of unknown function (DUF5666)
MSIRRRTVGRIAAWTAVVTLAVAGVAAGVAFADPGKTPTPGSSTAAPDQPRHRGGPHGRAFGHLGKHVLHGEFVVTGKHGKPVTLAVQRGVVTAVSAESITLKSDDGFTATYAVTADTKIRNHGGKKVSDLKLGDRVGVLAEKSDENTTARLIRAGRGAGHD